MGAITKKIWEWIEYNRFIVVCPVLAVVIWFSAASCTPQTASPLNPGQLVDAKGLEIDYKAWQSSVDLMALKFKAAGEDIQEQKVNQEKITQIITTLASGSVADWPGLVQLLIGGGLLGAISDNIRKRGLISGLKKNK